MSERRGPEVFIGLVGPVGTDFDRVVELLTAELKGLDYGCSEVRMSSLIPSIPRFSDLRNITREDERYRQYMAAGTAIRKAASNGRALAQLSIADVCRKRIEVNQARTGAGVDGADRVPVPRHAFVFNSLKTPDEIKFYREVYGSHFYMLAIHTPREQRVLKLSNKIADSHFSSDPQNYRAAAEEIINLDENENGEKFGQNVRGAYPEADYFVYARSYKFMKEGISRFVRLMFRHPFESPTKAEAGMFHAKAAALQSTDLSRQVGAVIADDSLRIIASGCNDVPKAGGGIYWGGDENDARDFQLGIDTNAKFKDDTLVEILGRLKELKFSGDKGAEALIQTMIDDVIKKGATGIFEGARVTNVIEFGRMIHAEMAAITQSARYGVSVKGATLYCTTFPCHMCARHIIGAGISKVYYIEPYPKSLAKDLYADSIQVDPDLSESQLDKCSGDSVYFAPFEGVAPRRYSEFFEWAKRKGSKGKAIQWDPRVASISQTSLIPVYTFTEDHVMNILNEIIDKITRSFDDTESDGD